MGEADRPKQAGFTFGKEGKPRRIKLLEFNGKGELMTGKVKAQMRLDRLNQDIAGLEGYVADEDPNTLEGRAEISLVGDGVAAMRRRARKLEEKINGTKQ